MSTSAIPAIREILAIFTDALDPLLLFRDEFQATIDDIDTQGFDQPGRERALQQALMPLATMVAHFATDRGRRAEYSPLPHLQILYARLHSRAQIAGFQADANDTAAEQARKDAILQVRADALAAVAETQRQADEDAETERWRVRLGLA